MIEARGMLSGGQQAVRVEGGEQTFLLQALQVPLHPLSPESHLRPSIENVWLCAVPGASEVSTNEEPRSGVGPSAVTFTKISKPLAGQSLNMWAPYSCKYFFKFVLILLCLI